MANILFTEASINDALKMVFWSNTILLQEGSRGSWWTWLWLTNHLEHAHLENNGQCTDSTDKHVLKRNGSMKSSYYAYFWFVPPPSVCLRLSKLIDYGLQSVLPLGEDPPVMTSVCFNHNGKILASGATDGMIRLFGISLYHLKFSVWTATRYKKKREEMTLPLIMMWQLVYLYM